MSSLKVVGRNGGTVSLDADKIPAFRSELRGSLLLAGDPGYEEARVVWNAMFDRRPAAIVRCAGVADAIRTVNFVRDNGLLMAVRAGGHNVAGKASCEGGIVLDLSQLRDVWIDPHNRTARVSPGALLQDFDHEAQAFGLATPLGAQSTTGVSGLTLGGGYGWLSRKHGLAIDNLISADVVTAKGELVRASEKEAPDLFWGIRGGGGNLGVVTSYEFRLHPVQSQVLAGLVIHRISDGAEVLRHYRSVVAQAPDELTVFAAMRKAPPFPFLPAEFHGTDILIILFMYLGDAEKGAELVKPLREFGKPIAEAVGPNRYVDWQKAFDASLCAGVRNYWKSHNYTALSDGFIDALVQQAKAIPNELSDIFLCHLGAAINRVSSTATAYQHRDAEFLINAHVRWEDPTQDEAFIAWAREFHDATGKYADGSVCLNWLSEGDDRVRNAYGINYDRLVELKNKYDPDNIFRSNFNVLPTVKQA